MFIQNQQQHDIVPATEPTPYTYTRMPQKKIQRYQGPPGIQIVMAQRRCSIVQSQTVYQLNTQL